MDDFCDLLDTPYAPVSRIVPVKAIEHCGGNASNLSGRFFQIYWPSQNL